MKVAKIQGNLLSAFRAAGLLPVPWQNELSAIFEGKRSILFDFAALVTSAARGCVC